MIYLIFFLKTVNKRVFFGSSIYRNWSVFSMITTFIFCYFLDFFFFFLKKLAALFTFSQFLASVVCSLWAGNAKASAMRPDQV